MLEKQAEFNLAMDKYNSRRIYKGLGVFIAITSILLQIILLFELLSLPVSLGAHLLAFIIAYVLTDLLNGLIHMIMDHHDNYSAFYGPLTAQFHLHHLTPKYTRRPLPLVYFHETGAKIWLPPYLMMVVWLTYLSALPSAILAMLMYIGVLSSVAEVSHYLCHSSNSKLARGLAWMGFLLSRNHHMPHHAQDNTNYAFLNGMTDPLINWIARHSYPGYKKTTDLHFASYSPPNDQDHRF